MVTMIRGDLNFILAQIKIAEADARGEQVLGTLIPNPELPWGLRRVDGSNNNLYANREGFGAADQPFPRSTTAEYATGTGFMAFGPPNPSFPGDPANGVPPGYQAGVNWLNVNDYNVPVPNSNPNPRAIQPGDVADASPRVISNLIVDQTANNPAAVFKALSDAGVADPFGMLPDVAAAIDLIKTNKAAIAPFTAAVASAQAALVAAQAGVTPALQATIDAYTAAAAATTAMQADAMQVDAATTSLTAALAAGGSVPNAVDAAALVLAQATVAALITNAQAAVTALSSDPGVSAADLATANDILTSAQQMQSLLASVNVSDGNVGFIDTTLAAAVESIGNALPAGVIALDAQVDASLAGQTPPDLAAATAALALAQSNLSGASAGVLAAEGALRTMLTDAGVTLEEAPGGDILKATLYIGNVAADEGLSAPFNGWMTLFGQFFDHGLDLVAKGGYGTVYIPLQPDDPLYVPGSPTNFMAVTRATLGPDGEPINKVTPFVDQNQTYTSNPSAQVFHREYEMRDGKPVATGRLLNGSEASGGGLATWADVKAQARDMLGIELNDLNIHSIPELVVDHYGNFVPGANGFPQLVRSIDPVTGVVTAVEGNPLDPVRTADGQVSTGHAFLDDIAHNAAPDAGEVADADSATSTAQDVQARGTYDNELLDKHYITGDGRGNENIGLTAVHHVFHAEHNRQVELVKETIVAEGDLAFLNEWLATPLPAGTTFPLDAASVAGLEWNGERLFQAAKFPTEMQYQHLVFEEFARKVQPAVNVFNDYDGTLDAAIVGEFAHTVYRFGHSMLTETVDRFNPDWSVTNGGVDQQQIGLIEAFLNPVEYAASGIDAEAAAGAIAQGMTRQRGAEIDEFVTEALRNNLVGLPLDLAAINIARGRETGVPTLQEARAEFFRGSGDVQVKPYANWVEFAENLKNPASVINFIAAYGTHDSITSVATVEAKRDAATALVLGGSSAPGDRLDFLNATGAYQGGTLGGLNTVDFWIGGLAEKKLIFGGMLGSTFNFIFETQLEALQNGDRFYYLSRLANLNLTAQLENNKFSEMIHRNTDATHLPGDAFARPDYFLEVDQSRQFNADLGVGVDPTGAINGLDPFLGAINGDRKVIRADLDNDGDNDMVKFVGAEHLVLGGTEESDTLIGGLGDDTLWGDGGDDILEGGDGNDFIFGGDGGDIITDLFGVNEIRAGAGNDVISVGPGLNLIITDTGDDVIFGGRDDDETLAGQGNDFVFGGEGVDFTIGGEGNDWLESGNENGLMLGDNGDLIQGLPIKIGVANAVGGDDIFIAGRGGNADMDAEGGDDIMVAGPGTDRFFGAQGFDWVTHKNETVGIEADMDIRLFQAPVGPASPASVLDRYSTVEGLTGSQAGDILRGDDRTLNGEQIDIISPEGGLGNQGAHALNNIDLIDGLREWLPIDIGGDAAGIFDGGNILMGGGGSDIIEGRGGDDLIDGDRFLNVRIEVTADTARGQTFQPFSVQSISEIRDRMLTGEIKVEQLRAVREIVDGNVAGDVDTAEYSGLRSSYQIEGLDPIGTLGATNTGFASDVDGDGFITVRHTPSVNQGDLLLATLGSDGEDRLKSMERVRFTDQTIQIVQTDNALPTGLPAIVGNVRVGQTVSVDLAALLDADNVSGTNPSGAVTGPVTIYWQGEVAPGAGVFQNLTQSLVDTLIPITGPTLTLTAASAGINIRAVVQFVDGDQVIERVATLPQTVANADGSINGGPSGPNPAATLGLVLDGLIVDGAPVQAGTIGILEDSGPFDITVAQLIGAITDPNGDPLSIVDNAVTVRTQAGEPAPGTLTFNAVTNTFTFTPAPNYNGGVVFEYDVTDGVSAPFAAEAVLEVVAVNDAPVAGTNTANIASAFAGPGATISFTAAQLIGNATDLDGDEIELARNETLTGADQFVTLANPAQGTIALNVDGSFTFTAAAGALGPVVLNYAITDRIASVVTTANLTLADGPPTPPTLSDVGPTQGQSLTVNTAAITDPNGTGPFSIQWQQSGSLAGPFTAIAGATAATFNPGAGQIGQFLRAQVSFTDGAGTVETVFATAERAVGRTLVGSAFNNAITGTNGDDVISGLGGDDVIFGLGGDDTITGGTGNDAISASAGDDTISWSVSNPIPFLAPNGISDGRDIIQGGSDNLGAGGVGDTFIINGNNQAETYRIYARADALAAGITGLSAATDIVVTRNGTNNASVIAELDEIEEIIINTGAGNDTVIGIGNFSPTNISPNTIHVNNDGGEDEVDASAMASDHRFVLSSTNGGSGSITGRRPRDVLDNDGDGLDDDHGAVRDLDFALTPGDVAAIHRLVTGDPAEDDEPPVGVRDLSGFTQGVADDSFIRLTEARHGENGSINPLFHGLDPRNISNILGAQGADIAKNAAGLNIFFMAFGQYVDHGLDFISKGGNGKVTIDSVDSYGPMGQPANFVDLTRATQSLDGDGKIVYQNQTSPLVDQNQAYGSHSLVGQFLREGDGSGGLGAKLFKGAADGDTGFKLLPTLKEIILEHWHNNAVFTGPGLPEGGVSFRDYHPGLVSAGDVVDVAKAAALATDFMGSGTNLLLDANRGVSVLDHYITGDGRANENITLTSMHTIWARNHDFHVDNLLAAGFVGSASELFQAAKILNEAEYQRVVFTEYADALLGGMRGDGDHGFGGPNPDADARISHEFAAGAFRFGHSLVADMLTVQNGDGTTSQVPLTSVFLSPEAYAQHGVGNILSGIATQQAEEVDFHVVDAIRNDLVGTRADLFAFNVARGWDVGLGTLNQVRAGLMASADPYVSEARGHVSSLTPYTSWEDFQARNGLSDAVINQFRAAYPDLVLAPSDIAAFVAANPDIELVNGNTVKGIDRVEFWVGGLAEQHVNGGQVGSTFWVVLHEQFDRLQEADRFYYSERLDNLDLYVGELEGRAFADIVARNTGLSDLQADIFRIGTAGEQDEDEDTDEDTDTTGSDGDGTVPDTDPEVGEEEPDDTDGSGEGSDGEPGTDTGGDGEEDEVEPESPGPIIPPATPPNVIPGIIFIGSGAIFGGAGDDRLSGANENDSIFGEAGDDVLVGEGGDDTLVAGEGDDVITGGNGVDRIFAGAGHDLILSGSEADFIDAGDGDDRIWGDLGRDVVNGGMGSDVIFATAGDGNDVYDGGADVDTIDFSAIERGLVIDLQSGLARSNGADGNGEDVIKNIENVIGGSGNDTIYANASTNHLEGGGGNDVFVFRSPEAADGDTISGFAIGDKINLSAMFGSGTTMNFLDGNQTFTQAGQIKLVVSDGNTIVTGNTDGNPDDDFAILIENFAINKDRDVI